MTGCTGNSPLVQTKEEPGLPGEGKNGEGSMVSVRFFALGIGDKKLDIRDGPCVDRREG